MKMSHHVTDIREIRDILISAIALAFVFSYSGWSQIDNILSVFPYAVLAVSVGFVLHELAHRYFARKYECRAEYKMWKQGLLLAVAITLLTDGRFVFAAPGAVMIYPRVDLWGNVKELSSRRFGIISIAGPLTNLALAGAFFAASLLWPSQILLMGMQINIWLGLFNMIPFPPLDGSKVFSWSKMIWIAFFAVFAVLFLFTSGIM